MTRTGVDDPGHDDDGERDSGAESLDEWVREGFTPDDAAIWRNWRYSIARARAWCSAGVVHGLEAAQWATAGVTEADVSEWRAAGIDPGEAVQWHEQGFDLAATKEMKRRGFGPADAIPTQQSGRLSVRRSMSGRTAGFIQAGIQGAVFHSYLAQHWLDDEALKWAKAGIDAAEVAIWKNLGVRPIEAERLAKAGISIADTVSDWWQSGIPYNEVAEWLGAGLSAREAAAQRAKGVTVEQAAALRVLRDQPDL